MCEATGYKVTNLLKIVLCNYECWNRYFLLFCLWRRNCSKYRKRGGEKSCRPVPGESKTDRLMFVRLLVTKLQTLTCEVIWLRVLETDIFYFFSFYAKLVPNIEKFVATGVVALPASQIYVFGASTSIVINFFWNDFFTDFTFTQNRFEKMFISL